MQIVLSKPNNKSPDVRYVAAPHPHSGVQLPYNKTY